MIIVWKHFIEQGLIDSSGFMEENKEIELRYGWTTGACATAASVGAFLLLMGEVRGSVMIMLPKNREAKFDLYSLERRTKTSAYAEVEKDAGDDPDVTHGAIIGVMVEIEADIDMTISFERGEGVGLVTKKGLPLEVGEPAINPLPRKMISDNLLRIAREYGFRGKVRVIVSVVNGEFLAEKTWNPRLGILGGISILGTTGIVRPYSCSAWIHSIHRGIDVAHAEKLSMIAGSTGKVSEETAKNEWGLELGSMIDMGDFVGGMLKYLRNKKLEFERIGIAGGLAKMTKLAQGSLDLHSKRSQVDFRLLSEWSLEEGQTAENALWIREVASSVFEVGERFGHAMVAEWIAKRARNIVERELCCRMRVYILVVSRSGEVLARSVAGKECNGRIE